MLSIKQLIAMTIAWSVVKGISVTSQVHTGWLLANSESDVSR